MNDVFSKPEIYNKAYIENKLYHIIYIKIFRIRTFKEHFEKLKLKDSSPNLEALNLPKYFNNFDHMSFLVTHVNYFKPINMLIIGKFRLLLTGSTVS